MRRLLPLLLLAACGPPPEPWYAQLQPDSPCYRVNLADGLDEASTDEVQELFACLNYHGHFASLEPTAAALESTSPAGVPAGIELARAANALPDVDVDMLELLGGAIAVLEAEDAATHAQDIGLELIYGTQAAYVRRDGYDLRDPGALSDGTLAPLRPVLPVVAEAMLDDDLESAALLGEVLEDPETARWVRTVASWSSTTHPDVEGPVDRLVPGLGEVIVATRSPSNDRWRRASGDSLRDLTEVATSGNNDLVTKITPELASILGDARVRRNLPDLLVRLEREGHLAPTLAQMTWLAQVDVDGGSLQSGEDSALLAMMRLLHDTNRPMRCTLDIWITVIDVDLGNLAVTLLKVLADQDPDDVQTAAAIMGDVLGGYGIGDGVLKTIANSGVCPALTEQVVDDLGSLDRLGEPQTRGLTHTLIGAVKVLRDGDRDHVEELVDVIGIGWEAGLVPPLEEVLRDAGELDLGADLTALVPVMDNPVRYGVTAGDDPAATLEDLLEVATWLVDRGNDGRTGWTRLKPLLRAGLDEDGTWDAVHAAAGVMKERSSALSHAQDLLPPLVDADPDLAVLAQLGPVLRARGVLEPGLRLLATEPVVDAMLATSPSEGQEEVPLAFGGRLIVRGTLDDLLRMVRIVVRDLGSLNDEEP